MAGLLDNQRYVIFDGPQRFKAPGTRYFAPDGTSTEYRSKAAKFFTGTEALDFAKRFNIVLGAMHYIVIEDFTDFDLRKP